MGCASPSPSRPRKQVANPAPTAVSNLVMSLRAALSVAAVAVLSLAACAVRSTRASDSPPRPAPAASRQPDQDEKAAADEGMRRFDALMRRGGALYELVPTEAGDLECERWSVYAPRPGQRTGGLERIRRDERTTTTTSFGYEWSPTGPALGRGPELTLFGPHTTVEGPEGTRGVGSACANVVEVSGVSRDVVSMVGNQMYLTQDACEHEHQAILARLRGLPPDGGTPGERMAALAGGGMPGC